MDRIISRREWLAAILVALALAALLTLPYLLGYGMARPDEVYTGILMNAEDSQSYFAKMREGYEGRWLYQIPFTPEKHEGAFVGGYYLSLGHLAHVLNLSITAVWHAARFVAGFILFLASFLFITTFLSDRRSRWTAYILALTGSGLGWLLFALGQSYWLNFFPVDFKMPEAHLFFSALTFSHVALGTAFLLAAFGLILRALSNQGGTWGYAILAGLAMLVLAILYPFMIYLVVAVLGAYWVYLSVRAKEALWRAAFVIVLACLIPTPLLIYYASVLQNNAVFKAWSEQSATLSPPFPHYLVAFGPLLILALLPYVMKRPKPVTKVDLKFLWIWIGVMTVLLFAPINQQRRFVQGIHVALAILAAHSLVVYLLPWLLGTRLFQKILLYPRYSAPGLERFLLFVVLVFMSLSNIYLLADVSVTSAISQPFPFFRSQDEIQAMNWLRDHARRDGVVMAALDSGNFIAAQIGNPVVIGHWAETVAYDQKTLESEKFYTSEASDAWRLELLARYNVAYVWYGPLERRYGDFNPDTAEYLQPVFKETGYAVFSVD